MFFDNPRLQAVLAAIDQANSADPRSDALHDSEVPREWLYGRRMSERLAQFVEDADEALQIAVRAQHVQRWMIPRDTYPMDRDGYKRWRIALGQYHAEVTGQIMAEHGYQPPLIERVASLIRKENFKRDSEAQTLEDVACLVFLEHYLQPFMAEHDEPQLLAILRKTWGKMSASGQQAALKLSLPPQAAALVASALG